MKVTVILSVIGASGTFTKGLVQEMEDLEITERLQTIQTTALLITIRIVRRDLRFEGTCFSESSGNPSDTVNIKNSKKQR